MSVDEHTCPEGYTPSDLLELLGRTEADENQDSLYTHVRSCPICGAELAKLQKIHALLVDHPESFHPNEDELYHFAHGHEPVDVSVTQHVAICDECQADVDTIREMERAGSQLPDQRQKMPQELLNRLGSLSHDTTPEKQPSCWLNGFIEIYKSLMRRPILAMGTAVGVLLVIVVAIPIIKSRQIPLKPESAPLPSIPFHDKEKAVTEPLGDRMPHALQPARKELVSPGRTYQTERRKMRAKRSFAFPEKGTPPLEREVLKEEDAELQRKEGNIRPATPTPANNVQAEERFHRYSPKQSAPKARPRKLMGVNKLDLQKSAPGQPSAVPETKEQRPLPSMTRVNVVLIGADRTHIPHLKFALPPSLKNHYSFVVSSLLTSETKEFSAAESPSARTKLEDLDQVAKSLTVLVHITKLNGSYKIQASMLDSNSGKKGGTVEEIGISQAHLERRIESAVTSLIKKKDIKE